MATNKARKLQPANQPQSNPPIEQPAHNAQDNDHEAEKETLIEPTLEEKQALEEQAVASKQAEQHDPFPQAKETSRDRHHNKRCRSCGEWLGNRSTACKHCRSEDIVLMDGSSEATTSTATYKPRQPRQPSQAPTQAPPPKDPLFALQSAKSFLRAFPTPEQAQTAITLVSDLLNSFQSKEEAVRYLEILAQ
jgi:hypothetical protein